MFYYKVLLPLAINGGFTYHSNERLKEGLRVLVDFKGSTRVGVVWESTEKPDYETKPILKTLDSLPIIDINLKESLKFFSFYYMAEEGLFLKSSLPKKIFEIKEGLELSKAKSEFEINQPEIVLTDEQKQALRQVVLDKFNVYLLFGVTGSGKTEVYLRLIEKTVKAGKKAVVLVPEIALTPQYIKIFSERFSKEAISIIHSRLTKKEKFENWIRFVTDKSPILIGTRSAIFVSFERVGLVVVDEENDDSYKQENKPSYNAKDIAIYRAKKENIPVILSSATPSIETLHKAVEGKFHLIRLNKRVGEVKLPSVSISKFKERELLTEDSLKAIEKALKNSQTVAVLINRRGFSRYLVCENCGYVFKCPNCSVALVYHKKSENLKCHWCDSSFPIPHSCPICGSGELVDRGVGSQKMEDELKRVFPKANIQRFDRDITSKKGEFERIINQLHNGKIDILVGTQMLSKGHDVSKIGVVVVSDFESLFSTPDFRAFEKGVSLIIQTAGRSGRKEEGSVIIQTSSEKSHLFKFIVGHDYFGFYKEEIKTRKIFNYPPFSRLIRVVSSSSKKEKSEKLINSAYEKLKNNFEVLGPSRCPIFKLRNKFRYHIIIKTKSVIKTLEFLNQEFKEERGLIFDIDPINFF